MTTKSPEVLWAQRSSEDDETKNIVYLTVNLPDIQEDTLDYKLTEEGLDFKAKTGQPAKGIPEQTWAFNISFFAPIIPSESSKRLNSRSLYFVLRKAEKKAEFWPRLTKDKVKLNFVKTDFSKWVDEDEQEGEAIQEEEDLGPAAGMGGMPGMGGMGGMGGMPGLEGMGGMGGPGGMDFEKMMAQMGGMGGMGGPGGLGDLAGDAGPSGADDDDDSDDDGPPPLEDAEPPK